MLKLFISASLSILFSLNVQSQVQFFKGSLEEVKKEAKKQKKNIFIDCYTVWCGPCKMLDKNVFSNVEFANALQKDYIPYKLDMELGEGIPFSETYQINRFPTMLVIDANGKELQRLVGYRDASTLISEIKIQKKK
jgi:thiol:disulfide interchange protein